MEHIKIDCKSYNIHTIKTNRFKTTKIEVVFRMPIEKDNLGVSSFLSEVMAQSSKKYPNRRAMAIKLENLYKAYYYAYSNKVGNCLNFIFSIDFINPEFIDDKTYLDDVISFLCETITKPNVSAEEFDLDVFNIVKNSILIDIDSIEENAEKKAINNALIKMDDKSVSSFNVLGTKEDISKITPSKLYDYYKSIMNNAMIDFFVIGNTNMDNIVKLIKKRYINHKIRNQKIDYYIDNKTRKRFVMTKEASSFLQSQLVMIYNLDNLTKDEKEITFHLLNYILGNGGLTSKLYRYIREENNYCYKVASMYFKYDNLLCIASSLSLENTEKAIKMVKKAIKEMQKGDFTEDDIKDAKRNLLLSLNVNKNNPYAILSNYEFKYYIGNYDIEEKIDLIDKITKEDIIRLAGKIKENTIYILSEAANERD
ncbi:MAG: insulinase family protein [Bacilli bacterium]|nr:insulinase family protein [Bacilli bacterium]